MDLIAVLVEMLPTVGFPIICVGAMAWFIYKFYTDSQKQNVENMAQVQARCQEREDKLYEFMTKQQSINDGFREIIEKYQVKLDGISEDIAVIKTDVEILKSK